MNQEDRNQFQQTEQEQTDYRSSYSYDHTYGQDPTQGGYPSHTPKPTNGLAIACLVVGILSIVTCCCGLGGVIFGCTGIFLAVMSRENRLMPTNAKIGLGLSIAGVVLGFMVLIGAFLFVRATEAEYGEDFYDYLEDPYEYFQDYPDFSYRHSLDDIFHDYEDSHI